MAMVRLSMNEISTLGWRFEIDVARYVEAGIPAIGVFRRKLDEFGQARGIELLEDTGLSVSNVLWAGPFTGSGGFSYKDGLEDAEKAIQLAADLKAGCLIVYTGCGKGHIRSHVWRMAVDALTHLAQRAADAEVTLALEPMHCGCATPWTFLTSLDDTFDLINRVGSPFIKLAFDTYHLGQDRQVLHTIPDIIDKIAVVHLGDGKRAPNGEQNRCCLGDGIVPLREIVHALIDGGYRGDFDVELTGEDVEATDYVERLEHAKQAFGELVGPENWEDPKTPHGCSSGTRRSPYAVNEE
jgi:sugar phosphate isomerase/epimerase